MPKRSAQEKLEHYNKKIRKLEEKVRKKRKRVISYSDEDDELYQDTNNIDCFEEHAENNSEGQDPSNVANINPGPSTEGSQAEIFEFENLQELPVPEPESVPLLNSELLSALGASTSDTPEYGCKIHETLANLWSPLLKKGLPKEEKEKLMKEYIVPENCKNLQAPKLNAEISAAVTDLVRARDKKILWFQQELGYGITAINRAMDLLLTDDKKVAALKCLSDGSRLLCDVHYGLTKDRTRIILPSLDNNFKHVIADCERDETLFGEGLSEKIKASKAIEKQGAQIKKNNKLPIPQASRPTHQGNWMGPPRYPSTRGRGGQKRWTSSVMQPRRSYLNPAQAPMSTSNTKFAQSKPRAPTHQ